MKKRGGIRTFVSLIIVLAMIASSITISVLPTGTVGATAPVEAEIHRGILQLVYSDNK